MRPGSVGIGVVAAILALLLLSCTGPSAAHYLGILDQLGVPSGWDHARTVTHAPGGDVECSPSPMTVCPYVVRFFLADPPPADAYQAGLAAVTKLGFELDQDFDPSCSRGATGSGCSFTAVRRGDRLAVVVFSDGLDDGTGVAQPGRVTVRVTADRDP